MSLTFLNSKMPSISRKPYVAPLECQLDHQVGSRRTYNRVVQISSLLLDFRVMKTQ